MCSIGTEWSKQLSWILSPVGKTEIKLSAGWTSHGWKLSRSYPTYSQIHSAKFAGMCWNV